MKIHKHYYVAIAILAVSAVAGELYFRYLVQLGVGANVPLAKRLETIPPEIGNRHGIDKPIPPNVLQQIGAMDTLQREYHRATSRGGADDDFLGVYIAYFGGVRGTAPHHPDICLRGAGFELDSTESVSVKVPGFDEPLTVRRDVYTRTDGVRRLVVWWEYVHGENVANRWIQRLKWALPPQLGGKRGCILQVQVWTDLASGPGEIGGGVGGDFESKMTAVMDFIDKLGPHIHDVLPAGNSKFEIRTRSPEGTRNSNQEPLPGGKPRL